MPSLSLVQAPQPFRVTAFFDSTDGALINTDKYLLLRDGVVTQALAAAWFRPSSSTVVELALVEPLLPGERYTLTWNVGGGSESTMALAYFPPDPTPTASERATLERADPDDPEAEAFGVDVDWLAASLTPGGDLPVVRGMAALKHDLAAITVTNPGELVHRPTAGLGLGKRVNGASEGVRAEMQAEARATYLADDRVEQATIAVTQSGGKTLLRATITTPPLARDPVSFTMRLDQ